MLVACLFEARDFSLHKEDERKDGREKYHAVNIDIGSRLPVDSTLSLLLSLLIL